MNIPNDILILLERVGFSKEEKVILLYLLKKSHTEINLQNVLPYVHENGRLRQEIINNKGKGLSHTQMMLNFIKEE